MLGTTIGHRYKILEKIGGGGMADVYLANDKLLNRQVAIKILHHQYINDNEFVKRFRREAQAASSLSHENIVTIYDIGEEKDIYYIVMEFIKGYTLKDLINKSGSIEVKQALDIAKKICDALDHAHQNKIIHRDIKPHNILIGYNGEIKVTDFGIARSASQVTITHTGSVLGSVHYSSPEQARGGWTDEKTDLYSLGIVLYEMVTGELPFSGESPISIVLKHLEENFVYPKEINPSIPQSVENIIIKALVKNPSKRYESAKEMLNDLETALEPRRINEPRVELVTEDMYDDEKTIIIPQINSIDNSFATKSRKTKKTNKIKKTNNNKWIILPIAIILIISLTFLGIQYFSNILEVSDVKLPELEGKSKSVAIDILVNLNIDYKIEEQSDNNIEENYVIKQYPEKGIKIKENQEVTLYVSTGKELISMPDIVNTQKNTALFIMEQKGFNSENIEIIEGYDEDTSEGEVFNQEPLAYKEVIPDETRVILFVSKGKEKFKMPDLIGLTVAEAEAVLLKDDLTIGNIKEEYTLDQPAGKIFMQFPYESGMDVTKGDQIDVYVSLGYPSGSKTVYGDYLLILDENEQVEIKIVIYDSREENIEWEKELITGSKYYDQIELLLKPGESGLISIYINNKLYQQKRVYY